MQNQPIQSERVYILKRSKTKHPRFHLCFVNFRSHIQFQPYTVLQTSLFPSLMFFPCAERGKKPRRYQLPRLLAGQTPRKDMLSNQAEIKTRNKEERESRPDGKRHINARRTPHNRMANATQSDGERHIAGWLCRPVGRQARDGIDSQFSQHQQLFASIRAHIPIIFINFAIHINRIGNKVAALALPNHRRL